MELLELTWTFRIRWDNRAWRLADPESEVYVIQLAPELQADLQGGGVVVPLGGGRVRIHRMRRRKVQPISGKPWVVLCAGQIYDLVKLSKKLQTRVGINAISTRTLLFLPSLPHFLSFSLLQITLINPSWWPPHLELRTSIASDSTESFTFSRVSCGNFTSTDSHSQDAVLGVLKPI